MSDLAEPLVVTIQVARVLESLNVRYAVGGSLASSLHGIPRATADADLVADLRLEHVDAFAQALEAEFYADREMIRDAVARRSSFNVIHLGTMFKIDVFVAAHDEATRRELSRRAEVRLGAPHEARLFVVTPEDLIVQKLAWFEKGGRVSDRQWRDVIGVLQVQRGRLDLDYLRDLAAVSGVSDLLSQVLAEVGIG